MENLLKSLMVKLKNSAQIFALAAAVSLFFLPLMPVASAGGGGGVACNSLTESFCKLAIAAGQNCVWSTLNGGSCEDGPACTQINGNGCPTYGASQNCASVQASNSIYIYTWICNTFQTQCQGVADGTLCANANGGGGAGICLGQSCDIPTTACPPFPVGDFNINGSANPFVGCNGVLGATPELCSQLYSGHVIFYCMPANDFPCGPSTSANAPCGLNQVCVNGNNCTPAQSNNAGDFTCQTNPPPCNPNGGGGAGGNGDCVRKWCWVPGR